MNGEEYVLTIDDVENSFTEHMKFLDNLWPDHDMHGPRKVHIVELLDAIRLRLHQMASKNVSRHESVFEKSMRRVTNTKKEIPRGKAPEIPAEGKSDMQIAFEKAREARRNRLQT